MSSIKNGAEIKELRKRIEALEQWVKDFEQWPKPEEYLSESEIEIVKRTKGKEWTTRS